MAHMQLEVEKQLRKKSPVTEIVSPYNSFTGSIFAPLIGDLLDI